jgi:DNA ligase (NAD+)
MNPEQRINELAGQIDRYNFQYYQQSISEISDMEFDLLLRELDALEKKYPEFKRSDSPTARVGGTVTKNFNAVYHQFPMLSLDNTYNEQDLRDFDARVQKGLAGKSYEYICELKFDGISLSIAYENGILVRGVTRGDGLRGDDITNNVKTIQSLPLHVKTENMPMTFEIRGEGLMPFSSFQKLNDEMESMGENPYANPRNAASGSFKLQDSAETAHRELDGYFYYFLSAENTFKSQEESLLALQSLGFKTSPGWEKVGGIDAVIGYIHHWEAKRSTLPFATDGIVIKINSFAQQEELGMTAKSPRWAIAFKYKAENKSAVLRSVSFQVGRTGTVTPVANLSAESERTVPFGEVKGVHISGTYVKHATLHNANELLRLDVQLGDVVFLEKSGEIIPKITGVDVNKRSLFKTVPVVFPSHCPECGFPLVRNEGEVAFYCPNDSTCPPQLKGRIEHFVARKAMNIDSLGEEKIALLFDKKLIRNSADLYDLTYDQLIGLQKDTGNEETGESRPIHFGVKTVDNILKGIEQSKNAGFRNVLFGLGIRFVGATVAAKLAGHFKNITSLRSAGYNELIAIPEIGERIARSILDYFADTENLRTLERLQKAGLKMTTEEQPDPEESEVLEGKSFVVSGTFHGYQRESLVHKIEMNGGHVQSGVSSKSDFLVIGENFGPSKLEKAKKLNVWILSENEFGGLFQRFDMGSQRYANRAETGRNFMDTAI